MASQGGGARVALRLRVVFVVMVVSFAAVRLGWLLAVLGFVERGELGFFLRMAGEALGVGPGVLVAPRALGFEIGRELRAAQRARLFRHAVLVAPPAGVAMPRAGGGWPRRG